MAIKEVDPISRIEGHLGVKLTTAPIAGRTDAEKVTGADVHGNLWRGFENFLIGRDINDAITFTQRICGVCPVPHGQASTFAVDSVLGYNDCFQTWVKGGNQLSSTDGSSTVPVPTGQGIPEKAVHVRNLVLSAEFLMSSITHMYHLAAPSYVQGPNVPPWTPYFDDSFYHPLLLSQGNGAAANPADAAHGTLPVDVEGFSKELWSAVIKQYVKALRIRRLTFEAGAMFAGRMPMTSCFVGGGVTTNKNEDLSTKITRFRSMMTEIGDFIVREYVPLFLALGALYPNYDNLDNATLLKGAYPTLWALGNKSAAGDPDATNTGWGGGCGNFLAWGAFPQTNGTLGIGRGFMLKATYLAGGTKSFISKTDVHNNLREHITYSRYQGSVTALNADGTAVIDAATDITNPRTEVRTAPLRTDDAKYSWLKAPRWNGNPMEVGPLARLAVNGIFKGGQTLASTVAAPGITGYAAYKKVDGAVTGLEPKLIHPDLAVACVRSGVATLTVVGGLAGGGPDLVVDDTVISGLDKATIVTAYQHAHAVITGPVADWVLGLKAGLSNMDRLRARAIESLVLIQQMIGAVAAPATAALPVTFADGGWLKQLSILPVGADSYYQMAPNPGTTEGFGATEAPRGALMHMCTITAGKIDRYQCIVPTTWNASPKDHSGVEGPMEQSMLNVEYSLTKTAAKGGAGAPIAGGAGGGVEALRVAQSFDPCIACAVH